MKLPINTGVYEVHRATKWKTDVRRDSEVDIKVHAVAFAKHRGMNYMEVQALCSQKSSHTAFHFVCVCLKECLHCCACTFYFCVFSRDLNCTLANLNLLLIKNGIRIG